MGRNAEFPTQYGIFRANVVHILACLMTDTYIFAPLFLFTECVMLDIFLCSLLLFWFNQSICHGHLSK